MVVVKLIKSETKGGGIRLTRYHDQYRWYEGATERAAIEEFKKRTGFENYQICSE
jgi:hypothetical protein